MTFSTAATFSAAILLTSCNNAEQVKKQVDEQNSKIQTAVDEKLGGLNEEVSKACAATVDSLAGVAFTAWQEEQAKATKGKKPAPKPKAKPAPKPKEEPKKETKSTTNPFDKATGQDGKSTVKPTNPFDKATGQEGKPAAKPTNPFDKATAPH